MVPAPLEAGRRNAKKYPFLPAPVQAAALRGRNAIRIAAPHNENLLRKPPILVYTYKSGKYLTSGEPPNMSIEAHLAELERRHRVLEAEIAEARAHPSIDDLEIVELKRRKLLVKDEIARLQVDTLVH
jgi:hypothetical protein